MDNDSQLTNVFVFNNNQKYFLFYEDENGKQHKALKNHIRVRLEVKK